MKRIFTIVYTVEEANEIGHFVMSRCIVTGNIFDNKLEDYK